jgi:cysteine-rich repeat protein
MRARLLFAFVALAACGRTELFDRDRTGDLERDEDSAGPPDGGVRPLSCGDGLVDPGEECDLGSENADLPAFEIVQGNLRASVRPLVRREGVAEFYDYRSASAHTTFERVEESFVLLYLDATSSEHSLIFIHGIDGEGGGRPQPQSSVDLEIRGAPRSAFVQIADDRPSELFPLAAGSFSGRWRFEDNSDGGAIGPLLGTGWTITLRPASFRGIERWRWLNGATDRIALDRSISLELHSNSGRSGCRSTCTLPRCGDGILDSGELCDDGNQDEGDACFASCTRTR